MKPHIFFALVPFLGALLSLGAAEGRETAPALRALVIVTTPADAALAVPFDYVGVDVSRSSFISPQSAGIALRPLLGQRITPETAQGIAREVQLIARAGGGAFVAAYAPPQDVTGGVLRVVVERAKVDGEVRIEGARYFSANAYRNVVPLAAGAEIDAQKIAEGIAWLNENPYRRASVSAEPGSQPGTTKLTLRVQEERPWRLTAGYSNTGTAVTGEDRVSASLAWGNAFGRGDQLGYSFSADPSLEHSRSHSANYTTIFRSRRSLTVYGAYSTIESELPPPLTQEGLSWQAGARFGVPLKAPREGWTQSLAFTADLKASDNTLEFAAIPITDNLTHVVQFGAGYQLNFPALGGRNAMSVSGFASPGGLSSRNHGRYFELARAGAKARYAYAQLTLSHQRPLGHGFAWLTNLDAQLATGALLGTEQLNGGGSAGVRGYGESTAFGDSGVLLNNELHLPAFSPLKQRDQADVFAFVDGAVLGTRGPGGGTSDLASAGAGLNYAFGRRFSLRAAYGWTLKDLPGVLIPSGHGHVSASVSF